MTAAFCETSIAEFVVTIVAVPLAAQYLEQQWGAVELLRFTGIVVVVSNAIAVVLAVLGLIANFALQSGALQLPKLGR